MRSSAPAPPRSAGSRRPGKPGRPRPLPGHVADVVTLLTDDVVLTMPPTSLEYQGRELAARFMAATAFRPGRSARLTPIQANGQPGFGVYVLDRYVGVAHANGLLVLTLSGLPRTLPEP